MYTCVSIHAYIYIYVYTYIQRIEMSKKTSYEKKKVGSIEKESQC